MPDENDIESLDTATTFADLYAALRKLYPVPVADSERIRRLAEAVADDFPGVELWDHLGAVLERAMRRYSPDRGPFPGFFALVLRRELRRAATTEARTVARERTALRRYKAWSAARDQGPTAFERWGSIVLDEVIRRLDRTAGAYLALRRSGVAVKVAAGLLGRTEGALWNRFGGDKLSALVRGEARRLVAGLPPGPRCLLAAHLRHEAELTEEQVECLFGLPVTARPGVRVLEEEELLAALGWGGNDFEIPSGILSEGHEVLGSRTHIACEHSRANGLAW